MRDQLNVEHLPALSAANVRELLQAVLPLPDLTPERARQKVALLGAIVAAHFVKRARSTASRLTPDLDSDLLGLDPPD